MARVNPAPGSADSERRERMMKKGGRPTEEEPNRELQNHRLIANSNVGCYLRHSQLHAEQEWKQLQSMLAVPAAPESSQKSGYAG